MFPVIPSKGEARLFLQEDRNTASVNIEVPDDKIAQPGQEYLFTVRVGSQGLTLAQPVSHRIRIVDNDTPGTYQYPANVRLSTKSRPSKGELGCC